MSAISGEKCETRTQIVAVWVTHRGPKFLAVLLKFFISEMELLSSERSDFIELAFISEVVMCWSRCDELCTRWLVAALLDVVLETICKRHLMLQMCLLLCKAYL